MASDPSLNYQGNYSEGSICQWDKHFPACVERILIGMFRLMPNQSSITTVGGRLAPRFVLLGGSLSLLLGAMSLHAQNTPVPSAPAVPPVSTPSTVLRPPLGATNSGTADTKGSAGSAMGTSATKAASEMNSAMQALKSEGKLTSNRAVSVAIRKVIDQNSTLHEIPAPMGARVITVHKYPGDPVRAGDKIVTLEFNGKRIPILAKQDGIMQSINVSKGGVIGNSRPRAAQHMPQQGAILITLQNI